MTGERRDSSGESAVELLHVLRELASKIPLTDLLAIGALERSNAGDKEGTAPSYVIKIIEARARAVSDFRWISVLAKSELLSPEEILVLWKEKEKRDSGIDEGQTEE